MRRRVFTLAFLLSLLLFTATSVLWARSYMVSELWVTDPRPLENIGLTSFTIVSAAGRLQVIRNVLPDPSPVKGSFYRRGIGIIRPELLAGFADPRQHERWWWFPGFAFYARDPLMVSAAVKRGAIDRVPIGPPGPSDAVSEDIPTHKVVGPLGGGRSWIVSYWLPASLYLVLPLRWALAWRRRRVSRVGICRQCSYDLTGNTSGVCPECGTALVKAAA